MWESSRLLYAERNFFIALTQLSHRIRFWKRFSSTAVSASGTLLIGPPVRNPVDVIAAWNASSDPDLGADAELGTGIELSVVAGVVYSADSAPVRGTDDFPGMCCSPMPFRLSPVAAGLCGKHSRDLIHGEVNIDKC